MAHYGRHRRRREADAHENHERWLVSYADFITLLFAFFVVMYALSSINEGKYRVMSDSISSAFRSVPGVATSGQVGINSVANQPQAIGIPTRRLPPNVKADAAPVSYTHLDVYKRQTPHRACSPKSSSLPSMLPSSSALPFI